MPARTVSLAVPRSLRVDMNRDGANSLDATPARLETDESFVVELANHGTASHVHLNVDDSLADSVGVDAGNHYVRKDETVSVPVAVRDGGARPVEGELTIVAGYGAERLAVPVRVTEPEAPPTVAVDESLGEVGTRERPSFRERSTAFAPAAVAVVGVLAVTLAVVFANGPLAALLGALTLACAAGAWYALR